MTDPDDLQRIVSAVKTPGLVGLIVGIASGIIQQWKELRTWVTGLVAAVTVAVLIGFGVSDTGLPLLLKYALIGVGAYTAKDILTTVSQLATMLRVDPFGFVHKIREAIKGDKSGS